MRYGSVCSGIEAATVAWHPLGWEPAWFAEIEPFPKAVLAHRWPGVPDLGDFTKIGADHGPVDLLVGGTPCQSFSIAGLRRGLDDPRGDLMLEFGALARRVRARWLVWENVPGVLSSNGGRDFGSFLGMLGELGYGFAYRVLDAQFFGVAQRRRRVFVVGHAGGLWQRAAAVLFERASLRGDPAPRREKGAAVAGTLGSGPANGGWDPGQFDRNGALITMTGEDVAPSLVASLENAATGSTQDAAVIAFDPTQITHPANRSVPMPGAPALARAAHPPAIAFHVTQDPISSLGATPALGCGNALGCGTLGVATPIDLRNGTHDADKRDEVNRQGLGVGEPGDPAHTLSSECVHGVASGMAVRRLTPVECARLQGFPDHYLDIEWNGKPAPDGSKYRALGNSMAVPVMRWIGQRIALVDAAVASLEAA